MDRYGCNCNTYPSPPDNRPPLRTVADWMSDLPSGYREAALRAATEQNVDLFFRRKLSSAVLSFLWAETPEGYDFWRDVHDHLCADRPLPKFPCDHEQT